MPKSGTSSIVDAAERAYHQQGVLTRSGAQATRLAPPPPPAEEAAEGPTTASTMITTDQTTTATSTSGETARHEEDTIIEKRAPRVRKYKRIAEAEEKLAELKLEEVRAALVLARARLAKERALAADEDGDSQSGEEEDQASRVEEWLEGQKTSPPVDVRHNKEKLQENEEKLKDNEGKPKENRENLPEKWPQGRNIGPPTDVRHNEEKLQENKRKLEENGKMPTRDIASLAAALTQAVRMSRDAPRFLQELPLFAGHSTGWLGFRAAYEETESMFSSTENITRLRRSLKGAALEAVNSLLISQPEPRTILQALERRFGRPDTLAMNEIQKIKALHRLNDSPRELCVFANKIANVVATIEALKKVHYLFNPELVKNIVEKLPPILRNKWYDFAAKNQDDTSDLKKMTSFLNEEADKCGAYALPEEINEEKPRQKRFERTYSTAIVNKKSCPVCQQEHYLADCRRFANTSVKERWEVAKKNRICYQCLRSTHRRGSCNAKRCSQEGCSMAHHRLLHHPRPQAAPTAPAASPPASPTEEVASTVEVVSITSHIKDKQAFLKVAPVTVTGKNSTRVDTYALLDDGSTVTLIDERLADLLDLDGPRDNMWVKGVSETVKHEDSKKVDVRIKGRDSGNEYVMKGARTVNKLTFASQTVEKKDLKDCVHLRDIEDQLLYQDARPRILIGQDNWEMLVALEVRTGKKNQPVASCTRLGWVLHGYRTSYDKPVAFCGHTVAASEEQGMENMMKRFFDLESLGIEPRKPRNDPEERALEILRKNSKRTPDGRFETSLLWKNEEEEIPSNYHDAVKRLKSLEKKLDRDSELKGKYEERIENLLKSGYAVPAPGAPKSGRTWYLPHFPVCNPAKPKIRLVHDAAARSHGRSLNDMLLSGPDLLQSLPGVIMRFRRYPVAVTADIKEMFMRIKIREEDRDALRFLWRGNEREKRPQEYQMTSLVFGATSSPCTALYIKNRNAEDFVEEYPRAAEEVKKSHYMDDYITSFTDEEEALKVSKGVDRIHRRAGFELRGWVSNKEALQRHFASENEGAVVPLGEAGAEKTLGITWEVREDNLSFKINRDKVPTFIINNERVPSKREALSVIMSLFDPLGLLAPVTMPAKKFMQETWRYGTAWDEPIPEELAPRWTAWTKTLAAVEKIKVPRCYDTSTSIATRELHTFVDASEEAYAAAVYVRSQRYDGAVNIALVAAKSRVAPLKPISIPRLELQAALLGARLAKTVENEHEWKFVRKTYWSDSRTVLAWIRAEPRAYKTFVAHRLAEIEDVTKVSEWRWVPTKENVADDATRATPADFNGEHRWFHGPAFLKNEEEHWPTEEKSEKVITGEERCHATHTEVRRDYLPDITRIQKWQVLLRATGRVLQFIDLCRPRKHIAAVTRKRTLKNKERDATWDPRRKKQGKENNAIPTRSEKRYVCLDAAYLDRAETLWLQKMQADCYHAEKKRIEDHRTPPAGDRLASLSVKVENNLIKLRGRVAAAQNVSKEAVCPIIMDGGHEYTKKYIQHVHEQLLHGGVEATVNELRQRFWVTRIRPTVKGVIRACQVCRLRKAKPISPATGDLPAARLTHHARPFSFTGLDYFGPVEVTVGRHREKRWVALFTCLTVRAVHLEVVTSLSADSAIAALRRFIARRGQPTELWTDNATCFKAAEKELKEAWRTLEEEVNARRINWRFIPPAAPFMGGAWERLVRSVKEGLRVTLHEKHPSDETLHTLLVEVENVVNSRPLTHVAVSPEDQEALTPNHILLGSNCHVPAPVRSEDDGITTRQLWKRTQHLADEFWRRWVKEYLPLLQHRREPHSIGSAPEVGEVVIVCDPNLPRNVWPRGRIKKMYPGQDGVVRVVDVETSNGHVLRRPCKKIVVLPGVVSPARPAGEMFTTNV